MGKPKLIPENIGDYLTYDEITGNLFWIKRANQRSNIGDMAGSQTTKGYIAIVFNGSKYLAHRIIWFIKTGNQPTNEIDHRNGNKADNTWTNLREATGNENMWNKGKHANNKSGFKGVSMHKASGRWRAQIVKNGKQHYLGYFDTPELAHATYCTEATKLYGDFANFG